jgi:oligosaccharide repeat unit polymerase
VIYVLSLIILAFLVLNFEIGRHDYLYPPFLFSFMFFVFSVVCAIGASYYSVHLSIVTVFTIVLGIAVFTFGSLIFLRADHKAKTQELTYINFSDHACIILIILQLVSIVFFVKYLRSLASAYTAAGYTQLAATDLSGMIKLYDTMTKFWGDIYTYLSVPVPMVYRITNPLCSAAEYMALYIGINNFILSKKVNKFHIIVYVLMIVRIVLNGSRSPIMRAATFSIVIYYILQNRRGHVRKGSYKLLRKIILAAIGFVLLMFAALYVMGRATGQMTIFNELFVYAGAPIANLNIFINRYIKYFLTGYPQKIFGSQTFGKLYQYIGKLLSVPVGLKSFGQFEFSGGYEIGNVYTMFASILYDFGIFGVIIIVGIMTFYFGYTYEKVMYPVKNKNMMFDFKLFIYAYLINDVIMSPFSNRFYETICDAPFIKLLIVSIILNYIFFVRRMRIRNGKFYFRN